MELLKFEEFINESKALKWVGPYQFSENDSDEKLKSDYKKLYDMIHKGQVYPKLDYKNSFVKVGNWLKSRGFNDSQLDNLIKESKNEEETQVSAKYKDVTGTIEALDYTKSGKNDLIEFTHNGVKKMVAKKDLELLD